jgi:DNA-binding MarR family transcriptional regulator
VPNYQLFLKAHTTQQYAGRIVVRELEPVGLPAFLVALLTHIRDHAPVTPSTISEASGVPMTTLRDNIQRLVERRLVRRTRHPQDGRSYLLEPTSRGLLTLQAAGAALHDAYLELEQRLPRPLHEYESTLDELNDALEDVLAEPPEEEEEEDAQAARSSGGRR